MDSWVDRTFSDAKARQEQQAQIQKTLEECMVVYRENLASVLQRDIVRINQLSDGHELTLIREGEIIKIDKGSYPKVEITVKFLTRHIMINRQTIADASKSAKSSTDQLDAQLATYAHLGIRHESTSLDSIDDVSRFILKPVIDSILGT